MACEVTIKIKDRFKTMTKKTRVYDNIRACFSDDKIDELVAEATKNFGTQDGIKTTVNIQLIEE